MSAQTAQDAVQWQTQGSIAIVTLNRAHARNAVDGPTAHALSEAFARFEASPDFRVAVLTGAGGSFCAGADLKALGGKHQNVLQPDGDGPLGPTRLLLSKPVIAAVEGHAVAGGFELAMWCDLRVAARDAVFGIFCRRWGVPLIDGGTIRLARAIGMSHALDLILTGRGISGDEALRMSVANRIVEPGTALREALRLAEEIAAFPQICMRSDRMSAYEQWQLNLSDALANEFKHGMQTIGSGEMLQGVSRFMSGAGRHGKFSDDKEK